MLAAATFASSALRHQAALFCTHQRLNDTFTACKMHTRDEYLSLMQELFERFYAYHCGGNSQINCDISNEVDD